MKTPGLLAPISFTIFTEKHVGVGEDAPPFLQVDIDRAKAAVFDGMGGAGALRYDIQADSQTGAYLASRRVRIIWDEVITRSGDEVFDEPNWPELFALELADRLQQEHERLGAPARRFHSTLIRTLPTTLAAAVVRPISTEAHRFQVAVVWAGDSRVYAILPLGAHQLSRDDLESDGDALSNLYDDSPMSNCISADRPFAVNRYLVTVPGPLLLIAATDGVFGYVGSPMHFEWLILRTLIESSSHKQWHDRIQDEIVNVTGDDATMALLAIGRNEFRDLQETFRPRAEELETKFIRPLDNAPTDEHQALMGTLWGQYKSDYERFMANGRTE